MFKLVKIELFKVFRRPRSYIGYIAIFLIVMISYAAAWWEGRAFFDFVLRGVGDAFYLHGNIINGYMVTYMILAYLWMHIPLLVVIVTGDLISGESQSGSFRLLLTRPVSRNGLISAKFIAGAIYTASLIFLLATLSMGLGLLFFGKGDLIVILGAINIIPEHDLLWRFAGAFSYGLLGMITVSSLALFISAFARNSLGPILATMGVIMVFTLVSSFEFEVFENIKPFLFTTYLESWQDFFAFEVDVKRILFDGGVLLMHSIVLYLFTLGYFRKKNILS